MLPAKPLEFVDFSGGITDNILQGDPRRSEEIDNLYITTDKKLLERPGIIPYSADAYYLPLVTQQRVNNFHLFINETELMPQAGRDIFYLDTTWTKITGKGGHSAVENGDNKSQTTAAEFQRQIYLATDYGQGVRPSKIYRDETNAWTAKTAGLPRSYTAGNFTNQTLLNRCLALANNLRTNLLLHFADAQDTYPGMISTGLSAPWLHKYQDNVATALVPAAATTEATLYTLIVGLNAAYTAHMTDAKKGSLADIGGATSTVFSLVSSVPTYHFRTTLGIGDGVVPSGPHAPLNAPATTPTTLTIAAGMLDDLVQKYNWHRLGVYTHDSYQVGVVKTFNNISSIDKYQITEAKIGNVYIGNSAPFVTPDFGDLYNYANNLKGMFQDHINNDNGAALGFGAGGHSQRNNQSTSSSYAWNADTDCYLWDCADLDSFYLMIYWLRALYYMHYLDAKDGANFIVVNFTSVAGSPSLTGVTKLSTGNPVVIQGSFASFGSDLSTVIGQGDGTGYKFAKVTPTGAGTATLDRNATASETSTAIVSTNALYHLSFTGTAAVSGVVTAVDADAGAVTTAEAFTNPAYTLASTTKEWLILAAELFSVLQAHILNGKIHKGPNAIFYQNSIDSVPYPNFIVPAVSETAYAFFFSDDYTVERGGLEYLVRGNPVFTASLETAQSFPVNYIPPNQDVNSIKQYAVLTTRANVISSLPVLTNDGSSNYDTSNVKLNIYRTTDGGNTFYLVDQVANGTTTYSDTVNDTVGNPGATALNTREPIYTTGGVVGTDQPPICKFIHNVNGTVYYGAITDTGQYFPNRIVQAISFSPDAAPATFFKDLSDELVGLSSARNNPIAFCTTSIFRLSGGFNNVGQGSILDENISDTLGCLNTKSIVRTEIGVFFAGTDGFYYTDGYQIIKISLELDKTYKLLTQSEAQRRAIYGAYDRKTRKVFWSVRENPTDSDNSAVYVFYLDFGIKPSGTFTTISNGLNFRPSSLVFKNGVMYFGHEQGFILKTDEHTKYDAKITLGIDANQWQRIHVPYDWTSVAFDVGTTFQRKWITKVHFVGINKGNISAQPYVIRDLNQTGQGLKQIAPINYRGNTVWGNASCVWGDTTALWKFDGKMDLWRRFPASALRSDFMQLKIVPYSGVVYSSSLDYPFGCQAIVDATNKTATIITPSGYSDITWPVDCVNMSVCFSVDGYVQEYEIEAFTGEQITYSDPDNLSIDAPSGVDWEIKGTRKEQRFSLTALDFHYAYLGDENQAYAGALSNSGDGSAGENP